jgi:hypothetical protein
LRGAFFCDEAQIWQDSQISQLPKAGPKGEQQDVASNPGKTYRITSDFLWHFFWIAAPSKQRWARNDVE